MDDPASRYGTWKAPSEDGGLIIWPQPQLLIQQTRDNGRLLSAAGSVHIQNQPLPELRNRLRESFGISDPSEPLLMNGHQAELHHPGVWVKNILIDQLAAKLGGRAYHVAVDTDAPKHLALRWPGGSVQLADNADTGRVQWSGLLEAPTPDQLNRVEHGFQRAAATWEFEPLVPSFIESMRRLSQPSTGLAKSLTVAQHELDASLGLKHEAMLASPLWESPSYLVFAHHVMARADGFAADYNAALAEYRERNGIRSPGRPMPDLQASPDRCEVPFWLDDVVRRVRTRATVTRRGRLWSFASPAGDEFAFDPAEPGWAAGEALQTWLAAHQLRLAPRALTLTAFLRLLAADQFVHGIGGAQYDQVTDALIARHFHVDPPRFSVTTATLYFPQAAQSERVCVPCVVQEGHRLKHGVLGQEKMQLVQAIADAPRSSPQRATLFHEMHDRLSAAWQKPVIHRWEQRLRETMEREIAERALFDRELFYAIQPKERLLEMIEQYRLAID